MFTRTDPQPAADFMVNPSQHSHVRSEEHAGVVKRRVEGGEMQTFELFNHHMKRESEAQKD